MSDFVVIYDAVDSVTKVMGPNAAQHYGGIAVGVNNNLDLEQRLDQLNRKRARISTLLFYFHGDPGVVTVGSDFLNAARMRSKFAGKGFEHLFSPAADVLFPSCKLAAVDEGSYYDPDLLFRNNGLIFLRTFAQIFLFNGGGRVGGFASDGYANSQGYGSSVWGKPWRVWRMSAVYPYYAYISSGGIRTRWTAGAETDTPIGLWIVKIGSVTRFYEFNNENKVIASPYAPPYGPTENGTWRMTGDWLTIAWESGQAETWDLPLYVEYQSGVRRPDMMDVHAKLHSYASGQRPVENYP